MRLDIGYDGTDFSGWAPQPGQRTVAGVLSGALRQILRRDVSLVVAGRTDSGVHATGQVAHADLAAPLSDDLRVTLVRRLSGVLPSDVRVVSVQLAPPGFDARFSATYRRYHYRVDDSAGRGDPLRRRDTVAWPRPLDLDELNAGGEALRGEHDFAAFCRRREGATTVRTVQQLRWSRDSDGVMTASVRADAFCHHMVRGLIGALLAVGDGRQSADWPASLLARRVRADEVTVAPAHGLTLVEVGYPDADGLAEQAQRTRSRRVIS